MITIKIDGEPVTGLPGESPVATPGLHYYKIDWISQNATRFPKIACYLLVTSVTCDFTNRLYVTDSENRVEF